MCVSVCAVINSKDRSGANRHQQFNLNENKSDAGASSSGSSRRRRRRHWQWQLQAQSNLSIWRSSGSRCLRRRGEPSQELRDKRERKKERKKSLLVVYLFVRVSKQLNSLISHHAAEAEAEAAVDAGTKLATGGRTYLDAGSNFVSPCSPRQRLALLPPARSSPARLHARPPARLLWPRSKADGSICKANH